MLLDPRFWLAFIIWTAVITLYADRHGREAERADLELQAKNAKIDLDREMRRGVDAISVNARKDQAHANATINALRADIRHGAVRLSVPVASCAAGHPGSGTAEARADLLPATAEDLVDLVADADDTVRDLDECIDKYNAVRAAGKKGAE